MCQWKLRGLTDARCKRWSVLPFGCVPPLAYSRRAAQNFVCISETPTVYNVALFFFPHIFYKVA